MRTDKALDPNITRSRDWGNPADSGTLWNALQIVKEDGKEKVVMNSLSGWERNHLFVNTGGQFQDVSGISGLDSRADGRGHAKWDFNRDGLQDIALLNGNNPHLQLFENRLGQLVSQPNRFVAIQLVGGNNAGRPSTEWSSRDGVGTIIKVTAGDDLFVREKRIGEGLAAQNSSTLIVGVGRHETVDLELRWMSGKKQVFREIKSGQLARAYENPQHSSEGNGLELEDYQPTQAPPRFVSNPGHENDVAASFAPKVPDEGSEYRLFTSMATWCTACKKAAPQLKLIEKQFGDTMVLYGVPVDTDDTGEMLSAYSSKHQPAYEILVDIADDQREKFESVVADEHSEVALPSTVLTDAKGRILGTWQGVPTFSDVYMRLEKIDGSSLNAQRP